MSYTITKAAYKRNSEVHKIRHVYVVKIMR